MKTRLKYFVFIVTLFWAFHSPGFAQKELSSISFAALADSMKETPKPVIMEITTDWCTYCKMQKAQIQRDKKLIHLLSKYYFVEMDAEGKEDILFNQKTYQFQPHGLSGGIHELAIFLGGSGGYPTWVFLNKDYQVVFRYSGVIKPSDLIEIISQL